MTAMHSEDTAGVKEAKLPRRDRILLPLLSLLTIVVMLGSLEAIARWRFPQSATNIYTCISPKNSANGMRGRPNATCRGNNRDTPFTEYELNSCGHRAGIECGPKAEGTYRIVMIGSSYAIGEGVPEQETIAALLPGNLSKQTRRDVQVYNEGLFGETPNVIAQHFDEVLAEQPDLILWILTSHDIKDTSAASFQEVTFERQSSNASASTGNTKFATRVWESVGKAFAEKSIPQAVADLWRHSLDHVYGTSSAVVLLQHVLYQNQSQYVRSYLMGREADFLKAAPDGEWQSHLRAFDLDDSRVEAQVQRAGIPLVAVLLPNRAQAAMLSMGHWPPGFDPYALDRALRATVVNHGGTYLDVLPRFRKMPNPEQYFFEVNGHPDARGDAVLAELLSSTLTDGAVPALRASAQSKSAGEP